MIKEIFTREEVIKLLVEERTRARDIAYEFKKNHDSELEAFKKMMNDDKHGIAQQMGMKHKQLADEARQIGNAISGSNALSGDETIEDRIKEKLG
jgi:hypothetical protein